MTRRMVICEDEMVALEGLPHSQVALYFKLRWHMDGKSRMVGDKRGISIQSLREALYVEPVRGRHAADAGSPSRQAVRSALDGLERAGLIRPCGNGEVLLFLMLKAPVVLARPKDEQPMSRQYQQADEKHGESLADSTSDAYQQAYEQHGVSGDEQHTSMVKGSFSVVTSAAAYALAVDNSADVLLAAEVCKFVLGAEVKRGKVCKIPPTDDRVMSWVRDGLTMQGLKLAYGNAVAARVRDGSAAPLNAGFLDSFVREQLSGRSVCNGSEGKVRGGSAKGSERRGLEALAAELGVSALPGESWVVFEQRVRAQQDRRERGREVVA